MVGFASMIFSAKYKPKLIILLLAINLLISVAVVAWMLRPMYRAEVKVVFNEVRLSFDANIATDNMFNHEFNSYNYFMFLSLLESDSLIDLTVRKHKLQEYFGVETNKKAGEVLRRKIIFSADPPKEEPVFTISMSDPDKELVEAVLMDLVTNVKQFRMRQTNANNAVTQKIASSYVRNLEKRLPEIGDEVKKLPEVSQPTPQIKQIEETLNRYYKNKLLQKFELDEMIQQISENENGPQYEPYFIINKGTTVASYNLWVIILLAVLANGVALLFELQLIFLLSYIGKRNES